MAKKKIRYKNKNLLNIKYRWEFLRRNKKYKKDFLRFLANYKRNCSNKDFKAMEGSDFNDIILLKVSEEPVTYFKKKYELGLPLNPDIPFDCLGYGSLTNCEVNKKDWAWQMKANLFWNFTFGQSSFVKQPHPVRLLTDKTWNEDFKFVIKGKKHFLNLKGEWFKPEDMPKKITLEVDLRYPMEIIMPVLENCIRGFHNVRKDVILDKQNKPGSRRRYDKYDDYLEIYDLHIQNKTYRQIAQIVYKDEYEKLTEFVSGKYSILPVTEKVKNNLIACKKLINDGYKIIR